MEKSIDNIEESKFWTQWPSPGRKTAGWGLWVSRLGPDLNESVWGRARDGNKNDSVHRTLTVSIFPWRGTRVKDKHVKIELFFDKNS